MALREIIIGGRQAVLRATAAPVTHFGKELQRLIRDLLDTVEAVKGAGLAAPQIGVSLALCVVRLSGRLLPLVNPKILWASQDLLVAEEGCLSLPDVWVPVPRSSQIILHFLDEEGREHERKLQGLDARIVQHEVDHLLGKLIIDYQAEPTERVREAL
jgi:peptide deformylase